VKNFRLLLILNIFLVLPILVFTKDIKTYNPIDLVSPLRIDIMAKFIYAQCREWGVKSDWPLDVYSAHIKVWGNYIEFDKKKSGLDSYLNSFHEILDTVKISGFDPNKPLVPVGTNCIYNGAHRVAACLLYNKDVYCELVDKKGIYATAEYFKNRKKYVSTGLQEKYLDAMALKYCELKKDSFIAIIFPCVDINWNVLKKIFEEYGTIVYTKKVTLFNRGPLNIIRLEYEGEKWLGTKANNFSGTHKQISGCFPSYTPKKRYAITVVLFYCDSVEKTHECKQKIRALFNKGKFPIHINDTYEEALRLAQTLFNQNSVHFLNYSHLEEDSNLDYYIPIFKKFLKDNNLITDFFCIDGSAVLAAYGIRDCRDLDFLHHNYDFLVGHCAGDDNIRSHNKELKYYLEKKDNLVFNPKNYFYYKGLKFVSLNVLRDMKKRRNEEKDIRDEALISSFLLLR
jgi:hypothetical protein